MKKFLFLFALISLPVFGQINFESGYFINNNNERIDCLIRNIGWQKNPTEIEYKLEVNDTPKIITRSEIKEFNVGNSYKYKRFKLKIDRSSSDINDLSPEKNPIWGEETLLLKILVEGGINLYQFEDVNLMRYFISSGNHEDAEQLVFKEYRKEYNGIGENNYFRQQLLNTLKSDNLDLKDFETLSYKKKELTNLLLKYNKTKEIKPTNFESKQNQGSANLKIIVGINNTFLSFNNTNSTYTFNSKTIIRIGFEAEYIMPFNQNKWSFFTDPNYQSYKTTETNTFNQSFQANYTFIELPAGLRYYMFVNHKSKIFINAGFSLEFASKSTLTFSGQVLEISNSANLFTGFGFSKKNLGIELRYNLGRNLLPSYQTWSSKYSSLGILVGYKFL